MYVIDLLMYVVNLFVIIGELLAKSSSKGTFKKGKAISGTKVPIMNISNKNSILLQIRKPSGRIQIEDITPRTRILPLGFRVNIVKLYLSG